MFIFGSLIKRDSEGIDRSKINSSNDFFWELFSLQASSAASVGKQAAQRAWASQARGKMYFAYLSGGYPKAKPGDESWTWGYRRVRV